MKSHHGYTLLEIIITLALAGILILFTIPGWQHFYTRLQSDLLIKRLQGSLNFARNSAIALQTPVRICASEDGQQCSNDWNSGWIIYLAPPDELTSQLTILRAYPSLTRGLLTWHSLENRKYIQFNSEGAALGYNGSFYYTNKENPEQNRKVIISPTGRVREE